MTLLNLPLRYTRSGENFSLWSAANEYLGSIGDESTAAAIVERCNGFDSTMRSIHKLLMSITAHTDPLGIILNCGRSNKPPSSKEKAVDRQMNDSVAERVASVFSIPVHIGKETGADEESIYDADGGFVCECNSKSRARVISEALNAISTLTADNAAKDAAIAALRTELTAMREATEGAKAIVRPFLNDIGGLKGKFHRGEESNDRGEALLKVYDQLTADIATTALSPAAKE